MARYGPWRVYAQHECLMLVGPCWSGDYILPAMQMSTCPRCGEPCDLNHRDTWARVVRRRVSEAVWHRPSTWGRYRWEYRQRGHLDDHGFDYRKAMRNARRPDAGADSDRDTDPPRPRPTMEEGIQLSGSDLRSTTLGDHVVINE